MSYTASARPATHFPQNPPCGVCGGSLPTILSPIQMSALMEKRKSRMVSFRLTAEDYRILHEACEAYHVRSVSELARTALRNLVEEGGTPVDKQIREMREQIRALTQDIEKIASKSAANSAVEVAHV